MSDKEHLTKKEFDDFKDNHFASLVKEVARLAGRQDVLLVLGAAILAVGVAALVRQVLG